MEFGTAIFTDLSRKRFMKISSVIVLTYRWVYTNIYPYFTLSLTYFVETRYRDSRRNAAEESEFHENRRSDSHTLLRSVNRLLSVLPIFTVRFWWNSVLRDLHRMPFSI